MSLKKQLARAGESLFSFGAKLGYNAIVTFGGMEYKVQVSHDTATAPMEQGGIDDRQSVIVLIPTIDASRVPVNARIGYNGKNWRVDAKTDYPNGLTRWSMSRSNL